MSDLIRRDIVIDALLLEFPQINIPLVQIALERVSVVDAVEVVRCSQCRHSTDKIWSTTKRYGEQGTVKCCNPNSIAYNRLCLPRDFCRVGERRDENAVD